MAQYNLIFQGEIVAGAKLEDVKQNIAGLFNADAEKTAKLFSGKPIVIKKNLDHENSNKYLTVLKMAGAIAKAVPVPSPDTPETALQNQANKDITQGNTSSVSRQTAPGAPQISAGQLSSGLSALVNYNQPVQTSVAHEGAEKTAVRSHDMATPLIDDASSVQTAATETAQGLQLAPEIPGNFRIQRHNRTVEIADTSHLSMTEAQTGSLQEFTQKATPVELPDISSLSMAEKHMGSLQQFTQEYSQLEFPDISALSMSEAQQGSLEGVEKKADPIETPDISHLQLS